jgi:hypothetical protein
MKSPSLKLSACLKPLEPSSQADPVQASLTPWAKLPCVRTLAKLPKAALAVVRTEYEAAMQLADPVASTPHGAGVRAAQLIR